VISIPTLLVPCIKTSSHGLGAFALLLAGGLVGAALTGIFVESSDDLMVHLNWEPRGIMVVTADNEEVCGVLMTDDHVTCIPREKILNDGQEAYGVPAVKPTPGIYLSLEKIIAGGREAVLARVPR